ncbi:MAG: cation:proton antiporter, partial [Muribaculaceae bacterium]|nr:cation:proton antiporter [Muribaculaceae bacterium]
SLVLAVLIVEDLFAVLMMLIHSSIEINDSVAGGELLYSVAKLTFFLTMWFLVGVFMLPTIFNKTRRFLSDETLLIVSIGLCFGMAVFSVGCGFSLALGAFVMGSILAGTSFAERIEHVVSPVKDLFGAVFFISVGMMVEPVIIADYWSPILLLSIVVIVGMIIFGTSGMLLTGQNLKVAIQSGFSLTQIGEFAFIIATLGMQLGVLESTIYPIVVAVSVITTFTTPYFIRMAPGAYNIILKILPKKLHFLIDRYSDQAQNESETGQLWSSVLRRYLWRVLLYSVILITLTILSLNYLLPWMTQTFETWGKLITATVSLIIMAPFLLAVSYPASKKIERDRLIKANARFDVPLVVMTLFRLLIALFFIVYLLSHIFSFTIGWASGIAIFIIILMAFSKRIRKRMKTIEAKFMENLNERELRRSGRNNNLVSNMHLAYMHVGYSCPFVGEKFKDSDLRKRYGVNIAGIQRGSTAILVPGADTRIFPGDQIAVIGTDEQIQALLPIVEANEPHDTDSTLTDIKMENIKLSENSPIVGKSIVQSGLRPDYQILLVSIQRDTEFINPDGNIIFRPNDILWVVGTKKQIDKLR